MVDFQTAVNDFNRLELCLMARSTGWVCSYYFMLSDSCEGLSLAACVNTSSGLPVSGWAAVLPSALCSFGAPPISSLYSRLDLDPSANGQHLPLPPLVPFECCLWPHRSHALVLNTRAGGRIRYTPRPDQRNPSCTHGSKTFAWGACTEPNIITEGI